MAQIDNLFVDAIKNFINKKFKDDKKKGILKEYEINT